MYVCLHIHNKKLSLVADKFGDGCMDFFTHSIFIATCPWKIQCTKIFARGHNKYVNFGLCISLLIYYTSTNCSWIGASVDTSELPKLPSHWCHLKSLYWKVLLQIYNMLFNPSKVLCLNKVHQMPSSWMSWAYSWLGKIGCVALFWEGKLTCRRILGQKDELQAPPRVGYNFTRRDHTLIYLCTYAPTSFGNFYVFSVGKSVNPLDFKSIMFYD